ncbi:hypothetical protein QYM36_011058 [Artemia franciscana]|uniref:Uncharacterized protein n=1 Tax=Artemia franciscana TaxID=6661 RepID=A0AA88L494_ARTSF|nr:hypothetical protein QYM36_011058 [Artemia franciscana]
MSFSGRYTPPSLGECEPRILGTGDLCPRQELWGGVLKARYFIDQNQELRQIRNAGTYAVCLEEGIAPSKKQCLVYSFGINTDWTFEEEAEDNGCEVLAFDPSINLPAHHHSPKIFFNPQGNY